MNEYFHISIGWGIHPAFPTETQILDGIKNCAVIIIMYIFEMIFVFVCIFVIVITGVCMVNIWSCNYL